MRNDLADYTLLYNKRPHFTRVKRRTTILRNKALKHVFHTLRAII